MKFLKKNEKGFTLVELIVVIVILGILVAIIVPRIGEFRAQADMSHDRTTLRTVQGAINMFHAQHGRFPGVNNVGVVEFGYTNDITTANYSALATGGIETGPPAVTHNLQLFLDIGTGAAAAMPLARSRAAGVLRTFRYEPATGAVTIHPALP